MSDDDDNKKKADAHKMLFKLVRSKDDGSKENLTNREARIQARQDSRAINRAIDLLNKELEGFRDDENVGLTLELENNKIFAKDGKLISGLSIGSGAVGLISGLAKSPALGWTSVGLAAIAIPVGLKAFLHNNRRLVKKDYKDDANSERDIVFEYGGNQINVSVTPENMKVIAEAYEAASHYLYEARSTSHWQKRSPQEKEQLKQQIAEGVRKTVTDYILDHVQQPSKSTSTPIIGGVDVVGEPIPGLIINNARSVQRFVG